LLETHEYNMRNMKWNQQGWDGQDMWIIIMNDTDI
jgi:hypothetical protein